MYTAIAVADTHRCDRIDAHSLCRIVALNRFVVERFAIDVKDCAGTTFAQAPCFANVRQYSLRADLPHHFFQHVLKHVTVERQIGNDLLEVYVFSAKLTGLTDFGRSKLPNRIVQV